MIIQIKDVIPEVPVPVKGKVYKVISVEQLYGHTLYRVVEDGHVLGVWDVEAAILDERMFHYD